MEIRSFVLSEEKDMVGISPVRTNEDHVVLTTETATRVYDTVSQRCVGSWLFPLGMTFSLPSHVLSHNKGLVSVRNKKFLVNWKSSEKELQNKTGLEFTQGIITDLLVPINPNAFDICVVFAHAAVLLDGSLNVLETIPVDSTSKGKIVHTSMFQSQTENQLVIILNFVIQYSDQVHIKFYSVKKQKNNSNKQQKQQQQSDSQAKIVVTALGKHVYNSSNNSISCTCVDYESATMCILWSNGTLDVLRCASQHDLMHGKNTLAKVSSRAIQIYDNFENMAACVIHSGIVAFLGKTKKEFSTNNNNDSKKNNDNDSNTPSGLLLLWDCIQGVPLGCKELETKGSKTKSFPVSIKKSIGGSKLYCQVNDCTVICSVNIPPRTLANNLGVLTPNIRGSTSTNSSMIISHLLTTTTQPILQSLTPTSHLDLIQILQTASEDGANNNSLRAISGYNIISDDIWNKATNNGNKQSEYNTLLHLSNLKSAQFSTTLSNYISNENVSPYFVNQVASRCLNEKIYGPLEILLTHHLLNNNNTQSLPALIQQLTQDNQINLVMLCIATIEDISPRDVIILTQYLLQQEPQQLSASLQYLITNLKNQNNNNNNQQVNEPEPLNIILNHLVSIPINRLLLIPEMKNLTSAQVMALLNYLGKHICFHEVSNNQDNDNTENNENNNTDDEVTTTTPINNYPLKVPSPQRLVEWSRALIDSQFRSLLLSTDSQLKESILEFQFSLKQYIKILKQISLLQGVIDQMVNKKSLPVSKKSLKRGTLSYSIHSIPQAKLKTSTLLHTKDVTTKQPHQQQEEQQQNQIKQKQKQEENTTAKKKTPNKQAKKDQQEENSSNTKVPSAKKTKNNKI